MATKITYNGETIANLESGQNTSLKCKGMIMKSDVEVNVGESDKGVPIEVDSLGNALLIPENAGKVYKCDENLYQVNKITSLKGLTIKFNEHITPCPVIGEDDEFECSGVVMGDDGFSAVVQHNPTVSAIKRVTDTFIMGSGIIAFVVVDYEELHYISADNQEESGWYVFDINGNEVGTYAPAVIYNFDCPALNENPEFMEWVFANAKVYPNFETANDIKSFTLNHLFLFGYQFWNAFVSDYWEETGDYSAQEVDISGTYTASFSLNGELITKTFTNAHVYIHLAGDNYIIFSNGDDTLSIEREEVDDVSYWNPIKYNDITLDGEITFTEFDNIMLNRLDHILSFILSYTTVSGEYPNGFHFVEYAEVVEEKEWFNDGNTHMWISISEGRTSPMVCVCPNGTVTVDWGDGTEPDVLTGTSTEEVKFTPNHHYAQAGDYVITLTVDGEMGIASAEDGCTFLLSASPTNGEFTYMYSLLKAEIGNSVTSIGGMGLCSSTISKVNINGATSIGYMAFAYDTALVSITIGHGLESIGGSAFDGCCSLLNIAFPRSVMSIGPAAFASVCATVLDFSHHTTIPAIDASAFPSIPDDCKIRVPVDLVYKWKTAENWSEYADHIVGV